MKPTVLIVEDSNVLSRELDITFSQSGWQTFTAPNGILGLDLALTQHPDLILLDIMLPEQNGLNLLKKLRVDNWGKTAKVILLTNVDPNQNQILSQIIDTQPSYYLIKADWTPSGIIQRAQELISTPNP